MPDVFDISNMTPGQIVFCVVVVILLIAAFITWVPKFTAGLKEFKKVKDRRDAMRKEHEQLINQINKNSEEVNGINVKIDEMNGLLSAFVVESTRKDMEIMDAVEGMKIDIKDLQDQNLKDKLERTRTRVLTFAARVQKGGQNEGTLDEYEQIFRLADEYDSILKEREKQGRPISNNYFEVEYDWLKDHFKFLQENNGFLVLEKHENEEKK